MGKPTAPKSNFSCGRGLGKILHRSYFFVLIAKWEEILLQVKLLFWLWSEKQKMLRSQFVVAEWKRKRTKIILCSIEEWEKQCFEINLLFRSRSGKTDCFEVNLLFQLQSGKKYCCEINLLFRSRSEKKYCSEVSLLLRMRSEKKYCSKVK